MSNQEIGRWSLRTDLGYAMVTLIRSSGHTWLHVNQDGSGQDGFGQELSMVSGLVEHTLYHCVQMLWTECGDGLGGATMEDYNCTMNQVRLTLAECGICDEPPEIIDTQ